VVSSIENDAARNGVWWCGGRGEEVAVLGAAMGPEVPARTKCFLGREERAAWLDRDVSPSVFG